MKKVVSNYIVSLINEVEKLVPTMQRVVDDGNSNLKLASMHKIEASADGMLVLWVYLGSKWQSIVFDDDFSEEEANEVAKEIHELIKPLI